MGELDDDADLVAFVVSANLRRRHLTDDQRAMVAAKLVTCKPGDNQHSAGARTSQAKAAKLLNVSADKVKRVAKVLKDGAPELRAAAEQGEISITAAALVAHRPLEEQGEIITAGPKAVAKAAQKMREKEPKKKPEPPPGKPEPAKPASELDAAHDPAVEAAIEGEVVEPASAEAAPAVPEPAPTVVPLYRKDGVTPISNWELGRKRKGEARATVTSLLHAMLAGKPTVSLDSHQRPSITFRADMDQNGWKIHFEARRKKTEAESADYEAREKARREFADKQRAAITIKSADDQDEGTAA